MSAADDFKNGVPIEVNTPDFKDCTQEERAFWDRCLHLMASKCHPNVDTPMKWADNALRSRRLRFGRNHNEE